MNNDELSKKTFSFLNEIRSLHAYSQSCFSLYRFFFDQKQSPNQKTIELFIIPSTDRGGGGNAESNALFNFEANLAKYLAHRKKKIIVKFKRPRRTSQAFHALDLGFAHIISLGRAGGHDLEPNFVASPVLFSSKVVIAYKKERIISEAYLKDVKVAHATHGAIESIRELNAKKLAVNFPIRKTFSSSPRQLFLNLSIEDIDFFITNDKTAKFWRRFYKDLNITNYSNSALNYRWISKSIDQDETSSVLINFFNNLKTNQTLEVLNEKHFGHLNRLNRQDINGFLTRVKSRLPKYQKIFEQAAKLYSMDWRLVAALGYQESHWVPDAESFTGVRGIMMLTLPTAKRLGVTDRTDVRQNIFAATKYLKTLRETLPKDIKEPDRTWMALASYNVGYGHLEDARILAQRIGLDPNLWISVRRTLPLLMNKKYYLKLKNGYARGGEAVTLVERVRNYLQILQNQ